jgi:hypothetical protein
MSTDASNNSAQTDRPNPPTLEQSAQEAAATQLGKRSKIAVLRDAIFADDLDQLAKADRLKVAQQEAKYLGWWKGAEAVHPDMAAEEEGGMAKYLICDDYQEIHNHPPRTGDAALSNETLSGMAQAPGKAMSLLAKIVTGAGLLGAGAGGTVLVNQFTAEPPAASGPAVVEPAIVQPAIVQPAIQPAAVVEAPNWELNVVPEETN